MMSPKKNLVFYILGVLVLLNILAGIVAFDLSKTQFLEVDFFDVGQGDAIFIESPKGHQILIDGGPGPAILEKLAKEMPFWDRTLDLIILTHPERDHLAGLLEVLKRYKVENILWTGVVRDTQEFKEWERAIVKEHSFFTELSRSESESGEEESFFDSTLRFAWVKEEKANIKIAQAGQRIIASKTVLEILYPFENLAGQEFKDSNNTSIVSRLVFNENSFLFTGDIYKTVEIKLVEGGAILDSNVLKVGHHGSKTSNSKEFIEKVLPEIAVISAGKGNSYGHPHQEVLDILKSYGIKILRTDLDGDIKITSDGEKIKYEIPGF